MGRCRAWDGEDPPGAAFTYAPGRSGKHAADILKGFDGILQVAGYTGYGRLIVPKRQATSAGRMPVVSCSSEPKTAQRRLRRRGSADHGNLSCRNADPQLDRLSEAGRPAG
nr:transposase [Citreicella sp. C3M06]